MRQIYWRLQSREWPRKLEFELHYAELPSFTFEDRCYFIVERIHHWRQQDYSEIKKEFSK